MSLRNIRLLIYDFDGVLTDNRVLVSEDGKESVFCNRSDSLWMKRIRADFGVDQVILSTETNPVVSVRAKKMGIPAQQGCEDKKEATLALAKDRGVELEQVGYVGNDVNDLEAMKIVGISFCPSDGNPEILKNASQTLETAGGHGVCSEIYRLFSRDQK